MFKSIFAKLLVTYLAILISVIAILSLIITLIYIKINKGGYDA